MVASKPNTEVAQLLIEGLRSLRAGRIGEALNYWDRAMTSDPAAEAPRAYHEYVKRNRIRLSLHIGKHSFGDDAPLVLPEQWPAPPQGLCDPLPLAESSAPPEAPSSQEPDRGASAPAEANAGPPAPPDRPAGEEEHSTQADLTAGASLPLPSEAEDGSGEYAVLEIIVDDEDAEPDGSHSEGLQQELPPPPVALDAPELDLAPPAAMPESDEPQDYVLGRSDSAKLESIALERLAGARPSSEPPTAPPPVPNAVRPEQAPPRTEGTGGAESTSQEPDSLAGTQRPPSFAEDAPTIARDGLGPSPALIPPPKPPPRAPGPPLVMGANGMPAMGRRPPPGASPHSTLAGLGPHALAELQRQADQERASDRAPRSDDVNAPPRSPLQAPQDAGAGGPDVPPDRDGDFGGEASFGDDLPTRARSMGSESPDAAGDYVGGEGSFRDDLPTQMRSKDEPGRSSHSFIRPMPHEEPGDFSRAEGSFSDDLPTKSRSAVGPLPPPLVHPSSTGMQRAQRRGPARHTPAPTPGQDFSAGEGSFSDDLPTQTRETDSGSRPAARPKPLDPGFRPDPSLPEGLVGALGTPEDADEELESLLDPARGVDLAQRLHATGEHARALQIVEGLLERYHTTPALEALLDATQRALEPSLLKRLGPPDAIPRPRPPEGDLSGLDLDPRAAFLFTRIDGMMSIEDILDVSGMSRFETARLLTRLRDLGLLEFEPSP